MKFEGLAEVILASDNTNPDAYLCIGKENPVLRLGSKNDPSMQEMADALNKWAGKDKNGFTSTSIAYRSPKSMKLPRNKL